MYEEFIKRFCAFKVKKLNHYIRYWTDKDNRKFEKQNPEYIRELREKTINVLSGGSIYKV